MNTLQNLLVELALGQDFSTVGIIADYLKESAKDYPYKEEVIKVLDTNLNFDDLWESFRTLLIEKEASLGNVGSGEIGGPSFINYVEFKLKLLPDDEFVADNHLNIDPFFCATRIWFLLELDMEPNIFYNQLTSPESML